VIEVSLSTGQVFRVSDVGTFYLTVKALAESLAGDVRDVDMFFYVAAETDGVVVAAEFSPDVYHRLHTGAGPIPDGGPPIVHTPLDGSDAPF